MGKYLYAFFFFKDKMTVMSRCGSCSYNPRTLEAELEGSGLQDHLWLIREVKAIGLQKTLSQKTNKTIAVRES